MATVSELIHSSFRLIGAIAAGEILETEELNDAFVSLNQLVLSWNTEGVSLASRKALSVPLVTGVTTYSLGGQPVRIESASSSIAGVDSPIEIVDSAGWEAVPEKAMLSIYIKKLYCDYQYPASSIYIWPTPRLLGTLEAWVYDTLPAFTDLNQTVAVPMGQEIALRFNFAVALLPEYPRSQVDPTLVSQAENYKASLVQLNAGNHRRSQAQSPAQAAMAQAPAAMGVNQ